MVETGGLRLSLPTSPPGRVSTPAQSRGGAYMYSKGMGYEPSEEGLGRKDTGETYRVRMGSKDIPAGIQTAMIGMKKGEKRREE